MRKLINCDYLIKRAIPVKIKKPYDPKIPKSTPNREGKIIRVTKIA